MVPEVSKDFPSWTLGEAIGIVCGRAEETGPSKGKRLSMTVTCDGLVNHISEGCRGQLHEAQTDPLGPHKRSLLHC